MPLVDRVLVLALVSLGSLACATDRPEDAPPPGASAPSLDAEPRQLEEDAQLLFLRARLDAIEIEPRGERRRALVRAGPTDGLPSWCGTFAHSNGYDSHELDLGPDGFFYRYRSCMGTFAIAHGTIASVDGAHVRLDVEEQAAILGPDRPGRRRTDFRWSDDLYVIQWAGVRFVVPAELMEEFCTLADAGGRDSMDLADYPHAVAADVVAWDTPWPLDGLPVVPERFQRFLPR